MNRRKCLSLIVLTAVFMLILTGCEGKEETGVNGRSLFGDGKKVVGKAVKMEDITEFYYTFENINYNAFYQRYRFYTEDGKYLFFHETRERKNDYGPATEDDTTAIGTRELSAKEWKGFYDLICDGKVEARKDNADSGDSGPWYYLYWKGDKSKYQVYSFASYEKESAFEEYCVKLASQDGALTEEDLCIDLISISYSPGYGDMDGSSHHEELKKNDDGSWEIVSRDREYFGEPFITTVYAVPKQELIDFELFIQEADLEGMADRPDSDEFITDYSPWNIGFTYDDMSTGKTVRVDDSLWEYREYTDEDLAVIKRFRELFKALHGEVLSQTAEEEQ